MSDPVSSLCPTDCDDDCDAPCHEGHYRPSRRQHQPGECPSAETVPNPRGTHQPAESAP